jgi:L-rhamnose mutarotase
MVKTYARTINLVPGCDVTVLREQLREVWPEVLTAFRDVGILKGKTFITGQSMFSYFECADEFDPSSFDSWIMTDERCVEWSQLMQQYEAPCDSADQASGEWWKNMEEVYCFETQYETQICEPAHEKAVSYSNSYMYQ